MMKMKRKEKDEGDEDETMDGTSEICEGGAGEEDNVEQEWLIIQCSKIYTTLGTKRPRVKTKAIL